MKEVSFKVESFDVDGKSVCVEVKGFSEIPFWNHDLKVAAALALLNSVDRKDYYNEGKYELFEKNVEELKEAVATIEEF